MNNKGFTLIELIIVVVILGMLSLLATPNIIKMINKNKVDNYNSTIDSIVEATEVYASDNRYNLTFDDNCIPSDNPEKNITASIALQDLIDNKDISTPVKNFCTDKEINSNIKIKIILNCGTRQFSYDIDESTSGDTLKRRDDVTGIEGLKLVNSCDDIYN